MSLVNRRNQVDKEIMAKKIEFFGQRKIDSTMSSPRILFTGEHKHKKKKKKKKKKFIVDFSADKPSPLLACENVVTSEDFTHLQAIVLHSITCQAMQISEVEHVTNVLLSLVRTEIKNKGFVLRYEKTEHIKNNCFLITCADEETLKWTLDQEIPEFKGQQFKIIHAKKLPKYVQIELVIPNVDMNSRSILKMLQQQNSELKTREWIVTGQKKLHNIHKKYIVIEAEIPGKQMTALRKLKWKPYFEFTRAVVIKCSLSTRRDFEDSNERMEGSNTKDEEEEEVSSEEEPTPKRKRKLDYKKAHHQSYKLAKYSGPSLEILIDSEDEEKGSDEMPRDVPSGNIEKGTFSDGSDSDIEIIENEEKSPLIIDISSDTEVAGPSDFKPSHASEDSRNSSEEQCKTITLSDSDDEQICDAVQQSSSETVIVVASSDTEEEVGGDLCGEGNDTTTHNDYKGPGRSPAEDFSLVTSKSGEGSLKLVDERVTVEMPNSPSKGKKKTESTEEHFLPTLTSEELAISCGLPEVEVSPKIHIKSESEILTQEYCFEQSLADPVEEITVEYEEDLEIESVHTKVTEVNVYEQSSYNASEEKPDSPSVKKETELTVGHFLSDLPTLVELANVSFDLSEVEVPPKSHLESVSEKLTQEYCFVQSLTDPVEEVTVEEVTVEYEEDLELVHNPSNNVTV